jgi:DNA-binding CsgD family transcriptional regulator
LAGGGLDRLTERERRILHLLASGHSIKSAAGEEAITENAANELLRSARRKLGVGSSREAARLLAEHDCHLQKNRHEKLVIPTSRSDERSRSGFNWGNAAMIIAALVGTTVVLFAVQADRLPHLWATKEPKGVQTVTKGVDAGQQATPASAPKVVRTVPAQGARIGPGRLTIEVTFDRPMLPQAYSFVRSDEGLYPDCPSSPRLSADGRTYSLDCIARQPGKYVMYFNRPPYMNFREAKTQTSAEPARLEFIVRSA